MSKKYVVEIKPEYEDTTKGIIVLGARDSNLYVDALDIENLEELNSDYINEHFGDLQDTAYQRGLHEGNDIGYKDGVNDGRNEAWEAARKIVCDEKLDWNTLLHLFNRGNFTGIFGDFSASEAIAKLKAYEEKQKADDKIKVGDIVERYLNDKLDSTGIYLGEDGDYWNCLFWTGAVFGTFAYPKNQFKKTGRHFDIASILEDMRND